MRLLFYSPDSYGLGHVRRTVSVAERVLGDFQDSTALVLTGAPRASYFRYPERCDYLKLPSVVKDRQGHYVSREIDLPIEDTVRLRSRLIEESADAFIPDFLLVDHSPRGLGGEILPTLQRLRRWRPSAVRLLGMRDVIDEPVRVREAWRRDDVIEVLRTGYDRILVYGSREVFDPIREYRMPDDIAEKVVFVGYLPRCGTEPPRRELVQRYAPRTGKLVVVTLGGGGDGNVLLRSFIRGLESYRGRKPFEVLAITGPLMSPRKRQVFQDAGQRVDGLTVHEHLDCMPELFRVAAFVVAMGGYNTVTELACAGAPALIVPRVFPRREQLVRARKLSARGVVRYVEPRDASPRRLIQEVLRGLDRTSPATGWGLQFNGLDGVSAELARLFAPATGARTREALL